MNDKIDIDLIESVLNKATNISNSNIKNIKQIIKVYNLYNELIENHYKDKLDNNEYIKIKLFIAESVIEKIKKIL